MALASEETLRQVLDRLGGEPIASGPAAAKITVGATAAALSGESDAGFTLLNYSSGGQIIYFGANNTVTSSTGFPLVPGAAIDRPSWTDLSNVFAIASGAGADLRVLPL